MTLQDVWRKKSDAEVADAANRLDDYTDEGRRVILDELARRRECGQLDEPQWGAGPMLTEASFEPPNGMRGIQRLWQGDVSLPVTYWAWAVCGTLVSIIVWAFVTAIGGAMLSLLFGLFGIAYYAFVSVAVWRSANRYRGKKIWAQLAQVAVAASATRTIVRLLFGA